MSETEEKKLITQLQEDVMALVMAWADRGLSPKESAMALAANAHILLAKLGFSLGELVTLIAEGWKLNNGKL